ncbi:MAG: PIN domain-containing protein [Candidatus Competibacteraceae bacterium]
MIIVIDTNVFIGACIGLGASNAVIAAGLQGHHTPLMGTALLTEYEDVLGRDALFAGCRLNRAERDELLDIFLSVCRWTRIYYGWRPNLPDEADNHQRGVSINRLLDDAATLLLTEFDAETRFRLRADRGRGQIERGLALLY